jgi:hypothetical protein
MQPNYQREMTDMSDRYRPDMPGDPGENSGWLFTCHSAAPLSAVVPVLPGNCIIMNVNGVLGDVNPSGSDVPWCGVTVWVCSVDCGWVCRAAADDRGYMSNGARLCPPSISSCRCLAVKYAIHPSALTLHGVAPLIECQR